MTTYKVTIGTWLLVSALLLQAAHTVHIQFIQLRWEISFFSTKENKGHRDSIFEHTLASYFYQNSFQMDLFQHL